MSSRKGGIADDAFLTLRSLILFCILSLMKLSAWAKLNGIPYKTAWKVVPGRDLARTGAALATGTILVDPPQTVGAAQVALYGRVSSSDQKEDLERQINRLSRYAAEHGLVVRTIAAEVGPP